MRHLFCPILIISLFIFISGCSEDPEPELIPGEPPKIVSTMPTEGGGQGGLVKVTFTLNKTLAEAKVTGAAGTTEIVGTNVEFTPLPYPIPPGPVTLTLTGKDASGQEVTHSLTFTVYGHSHGPELIGNECDPMDGASNVDPREYLDGFLLVFDEPVSEAWITSTKHDFDYTLTIIDQFSDKLMIEFVDYTMPYETIIEIAITVIDVAGNATDVIYGFATMAKAEI